MMNEFQPRSNASIRVIVWWANHFSTGTPLTEVNIYRDIQYLSIIYVVLSIIYVVLSIIYVVLSIIYVVLSIIYVVLSIIYVVLSII